jgi:hypothetical protein
MWDYNIGLVRTTHLFKCNHYAKVGNSNSYLFSLHDADLYSRQLQGRLSTKTLVFELLATALPEVPWPHRVTHQN